MTTKLDPALPPEATRDGLLRNFVGGSWQDGAGGASAPNLDPAAEESLGEVVRSGPDSARDALEQAAGARAQWAATSIFERAAILLRAAALLRERVEALARTMTLEGGKPLPETKGEVIRTAEALEVFAGLAYRPRGEVHSGHVAGQWVLTLSAPLGVAVVIAPWNFPLLLQAHKVAAALLAGNTVVLKPAEYTPLTAAIYVSILAEAGVPEGAVNLVIGSGSELGPELLRAPAAAVSFTGGNEAGLTVARAALENHLKYALELGGNNPVLVLGDADLDTTVGELFAGGFSSTGQKCTATRRVFVERSLYPELVERLKSALADKRLGPGIEDSTDIGPLVSEQARDDFERSVAAAQSAGASVERFGELPSKGFFAAPTLVENADHDADHVQQETFGPMVSLFAVRDFDEGLERCNDVAYGLSASLFSSSTARAIAFAERVDAGMVHVNSQTTGAEPHVPFGGMKASSNYSRELGRLGVEFFTQVKTVYLEG